MNIREDAAKYYDLQEFPINDVEFYRARVPSAEARVLELGCGTGRVLIPLSRDCAYIHGVDASEAMLAVCSEKVKQAGIEAGRAGLTHADITDLHLDARFDLIIAPFRVMQNLETDAELTGLMESIGRHIAPGGRAILNAFPPFRPREELVSSWCNPDEQPDAERITPGAGRLVRTHRRPRLQPEPLVLYPEIVYRQYSESGDIEDEAVMKIAMRCWYPDELVKLVADHGFRVTDKWGGYAGEAWGNGSELVIEFMS